MLPPLSVNWGSMRRFVVPVVVMVAGALIVVGGLFFILSNYSAYRQPSGSMEPTVHQGDRFVVRKMPGSEVRRGDIVVFQADTWEDMAGKTFAKRVVGIGGDTVACCDAQRRITVNGKPITESYRGPDHPSGEELANKKFLAPIADGQVYVLGDLRGNSRDSRSDGRGPVPTGLIRGVVVSSGGDDISPTTVFTDAGLPDAPFKDSLYNSLIIVMIGGGVLFVGAVVWLIVVAVRKPAKQKV